MKIISIGDLHGRIDWKEIDVSLYDKIIFIGDYADSYTHSPVQCIHNIKEIIELKKQYPDKVILLFGNHDIHYIWLDLQFRGQGFRAEAIHDYYHVFYNNMDLFQIAYQYQNYLWTHAGLTQQFYDEFMDEQPKDKLDERLNEMLYKGSDRQWLLRMGRGRGGDGPSGVVWTGKRELSIDPLKGINQIVGHTIVPEIEYEHDGGNEQLWFIDCLGSPTVTTKFLVLDL